MVENESLKWCVDNQTGFCHRSGVDENDMMRVTDWDWRDLTGYFYSEKLDGCRAYWDGQQLWTRGGNVIRAPKRFLADLPTGIELDGELWAGRGTFQMASVAARFGKWNPDLRFMVFDAPTAEGDWIDRMEKARYLLDFSEFARPVKYGIVEHREHASDIAADFIAAGGEGACFRKPGVGYKRARTLDVQRIKKGNLYAPWRKKEWSRAQARQYSETGCVGAEGDHAADREAEKKQRRDARPVVGLDVSLFPFDPEIEWNINRILSDDADAGELTRL